MTKSLKLSLCETNGMFGLPEEAIFETGMDTATLEEPDELALIAKEKLQKLITDNIDEIVIMNNNPLLPQLITAAITAALDFNIRVLVANPGQQHTWLTQVVKK